jgi:DNA-binding GntR family transcriptional regulator
MTVETQLNPTQPVNQQIYRILRRDIVHCLIAPGTPLSEKEVSVRFNVSRQPVREAFIKLAENGLIQIRPQRGSYVNKISLSQVQNGCFVRQAIECAVVRRAASLINDQQCYQLEQICISSASQLTENRSMISSSLMMSFIRNWL